MYSSPIVNPPGLKQLYRRFFRKVPVMAAVLDTDGRFIDVTDQWTSRTGYAVEELRGKAPEEFATPESAKRCEQEYLPAVNELARAYRDGGLGLEKDAQQANAWSERAKTIRKKRDAVARAKKTRG